MTLTLKQIGNDELLGLLARMEKDAYPIVAGRDRELITAALGVAYSVKQNFYVDHRQPEPVVRKRLA